MFNKGNKFIKVLIEKKFKTNYNLMYLHQTLGDLRLTLIINKFIKFEV